MDDASLRPGTGIDVKSIPYKIVYESRVMTEGKENWELMMINADGSHPVNLTKTPDIGEIYPHVSPDGTKICFEGEEGTGNAKVRSVYYMNIDGTHRVKVAHNARQACWGPDSQSIAFLKAEFDRYTIQDYATQGRLLLRSQDRQDHRAPELCEALSPVQSVLVAGRQMVPGDRARGHGLQARGPRLPGPGHGYLRPDARSASAAAARTSARMASG